MGRKFYWYERRRCGIILTQIRTTFIARIFILTRRAFFRDMSRNGDPSGRRTTNRTLVR
jgi:hypothetical protein